jgi:DNA uptake protein ComE-like DNA-binding protein
VGPALARRLVADRRARGPFGSMAGLSRVPGVGPSLEARLAPLVTFSGRPAVP